MDEITLQCRGFIGRVNYSSKEMKEEQFKEKEKDYAMVRYFFANKTSEEIISGRLEAIKYFEDKILRLSKEGKDTIFLQGLMSSVTGDFLGLTKDHSKGIPLVNIKTYWR